MDIHIQHNEANPRAGYSVTVRFRGAPPLHFSSPRWGLVALQLEHLLEGKHPSTTVGQRQCPLCRGKNR